MWPAYPSSWRDHLGGGGGTVLNLMLDRSCMTIDSRIQNAGTEQGARNKL